MEKALIIINAEVSEEGKIISASPVTERMVIALKRGIHANSPNAIIETVSAGSFSSKNNKIAYKESNITYCPLTIQLPEYCNFPGKEIYTACKNLHRCRNWVEKNLGYKTSVGDSGLGNLWLPILVSDQGLLFAEIIGEGAIPNYYEQPIDFPSSKRQHLHKLASNLLANLSATPSVYLLQFSLHEQEIIFDRLWPFPAAPALASFRSQKADLFDHHWRCLTGKAILKSDDLKSKMTIL
ncbi:hypothetical protein Xen7305DRAFT_00042070 [Xenococcus sp. PCC 7305]|uniref:hypothetical protein n=1 Tax=Xenococcus sp. PCC 7305 TaxID=102125 RepID=UPI0002AD1BA3|nr:hypothetical protein [Xenococcus sp. PCC 7305]ELS04473.1 hypothetical protein Xen7305DRAFT_00042070 [Xenococcus sp. PCC 7305]